MRKLFLTLLLFVIPFFAKASNEGIDEFNWDSVIEAIVEVESGGKLNLRRGGCCGPMQITKSVVDEVNKYLGKKKYKYNDRFNLQKSKEIFIIIQKKYNPTNNVEKAIRMWNGGPHYSNKKTNSYYKKVMRAKNRKS